VTFVLNSEVVTNGGTNVRLTHASGFEFMVGRENTRDSDIPDFSAWMVCIHVTRVTPCLSVV